MPKHVQNLLGGVGGKAFGQDLPLDPGFSKAIPYWDSEGIEAPDEDYIPEFPATDLLEGRATEGGKRKVPAMKVGVMKEDETVLVYLEIERSSSVEVECFEPKVFSRSAKRVEDVSFDEVKFDVKLDFDRRFVGTPGKYRRCHSHMEHCKDVWRAFLVQLYLRELPYAPGILEGQSKTNTDEQTALPDRTRAESKSVLGNTAAVDIRPGGKAQSGESFTEFSELYPDISDHPAEIWKAYNTDSRDFDMSNNSVLRAVAGAWSAVRTKLKRDPPPDEVLQEAMLEKRRGEKIGEILTCDTTGAWTEWNHKAFAMFSRPVVESWGPIRELRVKYGSSLGHYVSITPLDGKLGDAKAQYRDAAFNTPAGWLRYNKTMREWVPCSPAELEEIAKYNESRGETG